MEEERIVTVSAVGIVIGMLLVAVPRLLFPMDDPIPTVFGFDAVVLAAAILILLTAGHVVRYRRTGG